MIAILDATLMRNRSSIMLIQSHYDKEVLKRFQYVTNPMLSPLDYELWPFYKIEEECEKGVFQHKYTHIISSLLHLSTIDLDFT